MLITSVVSFALAATPEALWAAAHPGFEVVGATTHSLSFTSRSVTFIATDPPSEAVIAVDEQGLEVDAGDLFVAERKMSVLRRKGPRFEEILKTIPPSGLKFLKRIPPSPA